MKYQIFIVFFLCSCQSYRPFIIPNDMEFPIDYRAYHDYCYQKVYGSDSKKKNVSKALPFCMEAAENGYTSSQVILGEIYLLGDSVPQNITKAYSWFLKAAENGHSHAQYMIYILWKDFNLTKISENQALYWLNKSADSGFAAAIEANSEL